MHIGGSKDILARGHFGVKKKFAVLPRGEYDDALVEADSRAFSTFYGTSNGKTMMVGAKSRCGKEYFHPYDDEPDTDRDYGWSRYVEPGEYLTEHGAFDKYGELHSFDGRQIRGIREEWRSRSLTKSKFVGLFNHGQRHGEGVLTEFNGVRYKGKWRRDVKEGPFEILTTINKRNVTVYVEYDWYSQSLSSQFANAIFDGGAEFIGELVVLLHALPGKGILLDEKGIHVGEWKNNTMVGIEILHLCDKEGTEIELEHFPDGSTVEKRRRCTKNLEPSLIVPGDSELAHLQQKAIARYLRKKSTLSNLGLILSHQQGCYQDVVVISFD